jgi:hypothetical protein
MRRIDPGRFQIATQGTSREINRRIVLSRPRAPAHLRADLARTMGVRREPSASSSPICSSAA